MQTKTPSESETIMTEVIFPNDANPMGIVQGGRIMQLMDTACAICAQTHSGKVAVTASVDQVSFDQPVKIGDIITIKAKITRAFKSSMEIYVEVWARRIPLMQNVLTNHAFFTFVALDKYAKPSTVNPIKPVSAEETEQFKKALKRRESRIKS